ncbi:protein-glutamine gamma-glutamyltransferase [Gorillibacterium timonense]|uniref:protein-glutamine gamma-glutamyltransferase n=1 Tax=Gorillibacterium timonense TaxID=1689269 RepID=UPI00071E0A3C|nr:protein-glutamine gamma-glutamyltransferase [Gorillibacterium timonense]
MIVFMDGSPVSPPVGLPPVERMILDTMSASPTVFRFASPTSLLFELRMRANILHSSNALASSGARFSTFAQSTCNPQFWTRTPKGAFELRPDVSPADAIRDIYQNGNLYSFECATAMVIVLYRAIIETVGDAIFNDRFANLTLYDWNYDRDLNLRRIDPANVLPGDVVYFNNPDVSPLTPWWIGENAVDMGNGYYFGHGVGVVPGDEIIRALNRNRIPGSTVSASLSDNVIAPGYHIMESWVNNPSANYEAIWSNPFPLRQSLMTVRVGESTEHRYLPVSF